MNHNIKPLLTKLDNKDNITTFSNKTELNKLISFKLKEKNFATTVKKYKLSTKQQEKIKPKLVGNIRHYPPANKEWKNSVYSYNKSNIRSLSALDKVANKTIKSYFNLTNNKKLARSYRMRNLIRRTSSKRVYVSNAEIKQTANKVNITVYILNREGQFLLRKLYFYKKNMNINRDIYLHKIWLKKNLLAFNRTFNNKKSIGLWVYNKKLRTKRLIKNKTYIHNTLVAKYLNKNDINRKNTLVESDLALMKNQSISLQRKSNIIPKFLFRNIPAKSILTKLNNKNYIYKLLGKIDRSINQRKLTESIKRHEKLNWYSSLKNSVSNPNNQLVTFNNYFLRKKSRKLKLKLRNLNSSIKIKKKLAIFHVVKGRRRKKRLNKIRIGYSNLRFKKEVNFVSFRLISELKYIRKLFFFYFIRYLLLSLNIKVSVSNRPSRNGFIKQLKQEKIKSMTGLKTKTIYKYLSAGKNHLRYVFKRSNKNSKIQKTRFKTLSKNSRKYRNKVKSKLLKISISNKYSHNKTKKLELLNLELLNFLIFVTNNKYTKNTQLSKKLAIFKLKKVTLNKNKIMTKLFSKDKFYSLYEKYKRKYYLKFLSKHFKKEFLYLNYFSKFLINKFKFGKFLPGLKHLMNKIYSKKVKINIVNLKYPHLNSDIYAYTIASKLKKKLSLLRVLRTSLSLAKLPRDYPSINKLANYNKLSDLSVYKSLKVNSLAKENDFASQMNNNTTVTISDKINLVLKKLYPYNFSKGVNNKFNENNSVKLKHLNLLNIVKYKWVSGVRLEAAGRLTRRYTAARSVFKYRYKGSLKNIDFSQRMDKKKKNVSTVMLRNYIKANSQYSFTKSKRRIGAFGLKAWISGY